MWDGRLGEISTVEHHIPTRGPPIASQPYRAGIASRNFIDKEIQRMLDLKVIEPLSGPWSAPVVLITKPDGFTRFCVDYRKLNEVTVNDSYAFPRIEDCLESLGAAKYFQPWTPILDTGKSMSQRMVEKKRLSHHTAVCFRSYAFHLD
jgi:hypothetical protein